MSPGLAYRQRARQTSFLSPSSSKGLFPTKRPLVTDIIQFGGGALTPLRDEPELTRRTADQDSRRGRSFCDVHSGRPAGSSSFPLRPPSLARGGRQMGRAVASSLSSSARLVVSVPQSHLQEVLRLSRCPRPTPHVGSALERLERPQRCSSRGASAPGDIWWHLENF